MLSAGAADAHVGDASVAHDGLDVREVQIDESVLGDEAGDAFDAILEDVVRHAERIQHAGVGLRDLQQSVVGNDDERVDVVLQELDAQLRVLFSLAAFEGKGLCNDAHGEGAHGFGSLRDDRCSTRSGAAAHACGDEDHVASGDDLLQIFEALLCGLLSDFGIAACAQTLRQLFADLDLGLGSVVIERLAVGVDCDEGNALQIGFDHAVDRIAAGAADADDFNIGRSFFRLFKL